MDTRHGVARPLPRQKTYTIRAHGDRPEISLRAPAQPNLDGRWFFIIPLGGQVAWETKPKQWLIKVDGIDEPFRVSRH